MKKLLLICLTMAFAASAYATSVSFSAKTMAVEAVPYYNTNKVKLDNPIYYSENDTSDNLSAGNVIMFTLTNAKWDGTGYNLYDNATADIGDCGVQTDATKLLCTLNSAVIDSSPVAVATTSDNGTIIPDTGLTSSDNITVKATVYADLNNYNAGISNSAFTPANPANIINVEDQFVISVEPGTDTINVNDSRMGFVDGDNTKVDNDSSANVVIKNDNTIDYPVQGTTNLAIEIDAQNASGISYVNLEGNGSSTGVNDNVTAVNDVFTLSETYTATGDDNVTVTFYADGVNPLQTQTFTVTTTLDFANNQTDEELSSTLLTWDINGAQFVVPYLKSNNDTYVKINNGSTQDAPVTVDVYDTEGNKVSSVDLGVTVPANSAVLISGAKIYNTAIAQKAWAPQSVQFTPKFTVAAPASDISYIAIERLSKGDRVIKSE